MIYSFYKKHINDYSFIFHNSVSFVFHQNLSLINACDKISINLDFLLEHKNYNMKIIEKIICFRFFYQYYNEY